MDVALPVTNRPSVASECIKFNRQVQSLILADARIRLVILTGVWSGPFRNGRHHVQFIANPSQTTTDSTTDTPSDPFFDALIKTVRPIHDSGKHVILIDDGPSFNFDPLMRFESSYIPDRRALAALLGVSVGPNDLAFAAFPDAAKTASASLVQLKNTFPDVQLFALRPEFCDDQDRCSYTDGSHLFFRDTEHLSPYGAQIALRTFQLPALSLAFQGHPNSLRSAP